MSDDILTLVWFKRDLRVLDHAPLTDAAEIGRDYPLPIVDHKEAVKFARGQFAILRQRDDYWDCAREVMQRHGSRKKSGNRSRPKPSKGKPVSRQITLQLNESKN